MGNEFIKCAKILQCVQSVHAVNHLHKIFDSYVSRIFVIKSWRLDKGWSINCNSGNLIIYIKLRDKLRLNSNTVIDRLITPKSVFKIPWEIDCWISKLANISILQGIQTRSDYGVNSRPILALKLSKEEYWTELQFSFRVCIKMICF